MILFSDLFKLLLYHNNFVKFNITGLTSNYEQVEFSNKELSDLHNSVLYTECLLSGNFKIINMDIEYDFLSFKDSNEKSIIHAKCLIEVINVKKRIYVKKFILIVDNTVHKYISDIEKQFLSFIKEDEVTDLKIIQLDKVEKSINSQNKTKPLKIKNIRLLKLFTRSINVEKEKCFDYIFDNFVDYVLEFEINIFGKLKVCTYNTRTTVIDLERKIECLYKNIKEINSVLDKNLFTYIKNLNPDEISILFSREDEDYEFLDKDSYSDFNSSFEKIKNSDFESEKFEYFRNLLLGISKNRTSHEFQELFFNNNNFTLRLEMYYFSLHINIECKTTRFLNLIYSKELEEELEKQSIIGDC